MDSAVHEQAMVQPYYDSLVAKLIVHGRDRPHAIRRMVGAMDEFILEGIRTSLPMQRELLMSEIFRSCRMHTRHVDHWLAERRAQMSS